jgi:hypothetical protein
VRPDPQVFLHVLGGIGLFGALATVVLLAWRAHRGASSPILARTAFLTLLVLATPSWLVLFVFGAWAKSREHVASNVGWLRIGSGIADAGVAVLLLATGAAYAWSRVPERRSLATATGSLASIYLAALAVAWWVMTAKLPS